MDLHDYQDAAENYDRYLEVMYAHDDHHEHFREFYPDPARQYGAGGVVEKTLPTLIQTNETYESTQFDAFLKIGANAQRQEYRMAS